MNFMANPPLVTPRIAPDLPPSSDPLGEVLATGAERIDDRAVARIVEPAAGSHPVDADDVRLVLDCYAEPSK